MQSENKITPTPEQVFLHLKKLPSAERRRLGEKMMTIVRPQAKNEQRMPPGK